MSQTEKRKISEDDQSIFGILANFWHKYNSTTPKQLKIIDAFIVYCIMILKVQLLYCLLVGDFPRNSFLSGIIAPIGAMTITICMRKQLNEATRYMNISNERTFWEYLAAMVVLFLTVVNFLG